MKLPLVRYNEWALCLHFPEGWNDTTAGFVRNKSAAVSGMAPRCSFLCLSFHSSNIYCPQFSLYNKGMIFKACPLSALSGQEISLEGGRSITEGHRVLFMPLWWFPGSLSTLPEWPTHHSSGTACVWDGHSLWLQSFKVHFALPPASHSLPAHPHTPTLSNFA